MSLDQAIADLTSQAGLLLDLPQQVSDAANVKITELTNRYDGILANYVATFWVDQENGDNANEGTSASPFKDIQHAVDLVPRGGLVTIKLAGDYHLFQSLNLNGRSVLFRNAGGPMPSLTFERYVSTVGDTQYRVNTNISTGNIGALYFFDIRIVMPEITGFEAYVSANTALFATIEEWGHMNVLVRDCEIVIPTNPLSPFFASSQTMRFLSYSNTYPGPVTNPNGMLFGQQGNPAGVASNTLPWLVTNLTTV